MKHVITDFDGTLADTNVPYHYMAVSICRRAIRIHGVPIKIPTLVEYLRDYRPPMVGYLSKLGVPGTADEIRAQASALCNGYRFSLFPDTLEVLSTLSK